MKFNNILNNIFESKLNIKILRMLSTASGSIKCSGNQVAKFLEISPTTSTFLLNKLVNQNVLNKIIIGNTHKYFFNIKNYIVSDIILPMFEKEKLLLEQTFDFLKKQIKIKIESLVLFGSVARKEEKTESDYDLLIVVKNLSIKKKIENEFDEISHQFYLKFGKSLGTYILTVNELKEKYNEKLEVIQEIMKDGILIKGKSIFNILKKEIENGI